MVNLTRIYTRTGDQGTTALGDMSRTAKTDLRISAYADANEANAVIGTAVALGRLAEEIVKVLVRVQNDLFDVGADCPLQSSRTPSTRLCASSSPTSTSWRRTATASTRDWRSCGASSSRVVRRGRRCCTRPARSSGARSARRGRHLRRTGRAMNDLTATYLNRLSDLLFILARTVNKEVGDVLWVPGGER